LKTDIRALRLDSNGCRNTLKKELR
jgi:hypothetical protein